MNGHTENKKNTYAHLDRLSTEALEELLCADIKSPDDDDDEVVLHILEVIEQREKAIPTGRLSDVDKALEEFQTYYNIPEMNGVTLWILELGFDENFLSLRIASVSHIHIGFGDRIDFIGVDAARARLTEIGLRRRLRGIDALPTGAAEYRITGQARARRREGAADVERNLFLAGATASCDK